MQGCLLQGVGSPWPPAAWGHPQFGVGVFTHGGQEGRRLAAWWPCHVLGRRVAAPGSLVWRGTPGQEVGATLGLGLHRQPLGQESRGWVALGRQGVARSGQGMAWRRQEVALGRQEVAWRRQEVAPDRQGVA